MATIDFTGRGTPVIPPFSTAPVTVSRSVVDGAMETVTDRGVSTVEGVADHGLQRALVEQGADSANGPVSEAPGAPAQGADPEEMYEQVLQRLRRDLIAELEQNGQLLRDNL